MVTSTVLLATQYRDFCARVMISPPPNLQNIFMVSLSPSMYVTYLAAEIAASALHVTKKCVMSSCLLQY